MYIKKTRGELENRNKSNKKGQKKIFNLMQQLKHYTFFSLKRK